MEGYPYTFNIAYYILAIRYHWTSYHHGLAFSSKNNNELFILNVVPYCPIQLKGYISSLLKLNSKSTK